VVLYSVTIGFKKNSSGYPIS